jgi:hypothetical protein
MAAADPPAAGGLGGRIVGAAGPEELLVGFSPSDVGRRLPPRRGQPEPNGNGDPDRNENEREQAETCDKEDPGHDAGEDEDHDDGRHAGRFFFPRVRA